MVYIDLGRFWGIDRLIYHLTQDIDQEFGNFDLLLTIRPITMYERSTRTCVSSGGPSTKNDQRRDVLIPSVDLQYLSTSGSPGKEGECGWTQFSDLS
jgi:hypothetical protein